MKYLLTLLFLIPAFGSAQPFPCEDSKIGQLIIKPLVYEDGKTHYEKAVRLKEDARPNPGDFTSINKYPAGDTNIYIARHKTLNENAQVDLLVVTNKSGTCTYQMSYIGKDKLYAIRINSNGEVIDWDANTPLTEREKSEQQKQVDEWLALF